MRKFICCMLVILVVFSLFTVAFAETVEFSYTCYTNEAKVGARAKKADSENNFYVRQTATSDKFPVRYTSRSSAGNVVSSAIVFASGETGRKSASYYSTYTVDVGAYYDLRILPTDNVYPGRAELLVQGRWTP